MTANRLRLIRLMGLLLLTTLWAAACRPSVTPEPAVNEAATVTQIAADVLATQAAAVPPDTPTPTVNAPATARAETRAVDDAEATARAVSVVATLDHYTAVAVTAIAQETIDIAIRLTEVQATDDAFKLQLTAVAEAEAAMAAAYEGSAEELAQAALLYKELAYGPADGSMIHLDEYVAVTDEPVEWFYNFMVETTFYNPYSLTESGWDYGIVFREYEANDQFRLVIFSNGQWELRDHTEDDSVRLSAGAVPGFDNAAGGANSVRLIAYRDRGLVYINGQYAGEINLSARTRAGWLLLGTGLYAGNKIAGRQTDFEGFSVWTLPG